MCLDCGGDYMTVQVCQNSQNCMLIKVNFTVRKLYFNKNIGEKKLENHYLCAYFPWACAMGNRENAKQEIRTGRMELVIWVHVDSSEKALRMHACYNFHICKWALWLVASNYWLFANMILSFTHHYFSTCCSLCHSLHLSPFSPSKILHMLEESLLVTPRILFCSPSMFSLWFVYASILEPIASWKCLLTGLSLCPSSLEFWTSRNPKAITFSLKKFNVMHTMVNNWRMKKLQKRNAFLYMNIYMNTLKVVLCILSQCNNISKVIHQIHKTSVAQWKSKCTRIQKLQ